MRYNPMLFLLSVVFPTCTETRKDKSSAGADIFNGDTAAIYEGESNFKSLKQLTYRGDNAE
jgi:hypothetical protein